jgi:hypothetical protein
MKYLAAPFVGLLFLVGIGFCTAAGIAVIFASFLVASALGAGGDTQILYGIGWFLFLFVTFVGAGVISDDF